MLKNKKNQRDDLTGVTRISLAILCCLLLAIPSSQGQKLIPFVSCSLTGASPVTQGQTATYSLSGSCSATSWSCSCGTIQGSTSTSVTIFFNVLTCSSSTITANGTTASKTVTVNAPPTLTGGTISNPSQAINYNTTPAAISASSAGGGYCPDGYTYQWYSSTDNVHFNPISGAGNQNYQPGALTTTTYYKRAVNCGTQAVYTTNTATVTVYPQLVAGTISPSSQTITYNTAPATLNFSGTTGGNGTYSYQWQSSANTAFSSPANLGTNSASYSPPALTAPNTYYHVIVTSNGVSVTSGYCTVIVAPQLVAGAIAGPAHSIPNGGSTTITGTQGASGGNCSGNYNYSWWFSLDGTHYTPNSVATASYSPGPLTQTTYYIRQVSCGTELVNSNGVTVNVDPPLVSGTVSPSSQTIGYNKTPLPLTVTGTSGGNGNYNYQWQSSPTISGIYTPVSNTQAALTSTTFFEVVTTSNGVSVTSAPAVINVNPQLFPGNMAVSSITIAPGTSPGILTATAATGGNCNGNYVYQWQIFSNATNNFTSIPGATGLAYAPGVLSTAESYRRMVICGIDTGYTVPFTVNIGAIDLNLNYIRERNIAKPGIMDTVTAGQVTDPHAVRQTTRYFDDLGRLVQTVARMSTPLQNDLVAPTVYDAFGREAVHYMPYASGTNDGNYKPDPIGDLSAFNSGQFPGQQFFYGQTDYENSPLNRVLKTYAPGNSWVGNAMGTSLQYLFNTPADSVVIWTIGPAMGITPVSGGYYAAGELEKTISTDEMNHQSIEYKDKLGHTILKKVEINPTVSAGPSGWLCTYYIYDDLIHLRYVIQPQGVKLLMANNWTFDGGVWSSSSIARQQTFSYEYDAKERMIIKRVPGAGELWMVYDIRDRQVMEQDSALRAQGIWHYTQYDSLNRPVLTGLWTTAGNITAQQSLAGSVINYPNPGSNNTILQQIYYDSYNWVSTSGSGLSSGFIGSVVSSNFSAPDNTNFPYPQPVAATAATAGMVTGTRTNVVGSATYLYAVNFYDDHYREIQTQNSNYSGGRDTATTQYSFAGQSLRTLVGHGKGGVNPQNYQVLTKNFYDAAGRVSAVTEKAGSSPEDSIAVNQYDELGQLSFKKLGRTRIGLTNPNYTVNPLDTLRYTYNVRGWLSGINKDYANAANGASNWFGMELDYDAGFPQPQLNGNISGTRWRSNGDGERRQYGFTYDYANRLTGASFAQYTGGSWNLNAGIDFSVSSLNYDANGNILNMSQKGLVLNTSQVIDSLVYGYNANSNQLNYVTDKMNDTAYHLGDFTEINNNTSPDYSYDGNGNLVMDNNKGIDQIGYNYLNLPQTIHVQHKGTISYTYDAGGNKLQKTTMDSTVSKRMVTTYIGPFIYQYSLPFSGGSPLDSLQFIMQPEGRIRPKNVGLSDTMYYDFFEKDHLDNTRVVLTDQTQQDIYPAADLENNSGALSTEEGYYTINLADTVKVNSIASWPATTGNNYPNNNGNPPYNNNPGANTSATSSIVYRLNGSTGDKTGLGITLKVMTGDIIDIYGKSFYHLNIGQTPDNSHLITSALANFIASFAGTPTVAGAAKGATASALNNSTATTGGLNGWLGSIPNPGTASIPRAYINWILFDAHFVVVSTGCGFDGVSTSADAVKSHHSTVSIPVGGYLYVYCSNESNVDVFFDNLQVIDTRGPLLETTNYYPFGLTMAGISDKALKTGYAENKYRFNKGSELQNKEFSDGSGLEMYETQLRELDPQLGRWWQIDPKTDGYENESPYASMYDDPILKNDPLGDEAESGCCKELVGALEVLAAGLEYTMSPHSPAAEGTRKVIVSAGSTMNGMLNTVTVGAWPTNPAGALGIPSETNPSATTMGQLGGMFIDPLTGSPNIQVAPADGVSLIGKPSVSVSPGLPAGKLDASATSEPYKRPNNATTPEQRKSVQDKPCAKCGVEGGKRVAGHKKALVKEHYETGAIDKKKMRSVDAVQPECTTCSAKEGAEMSQYSKEQKKKNGSN